MLSGSCEACGELFDTLDPLPSVADIGEFVDEQGEHRIAHADCGRNQPGWRLA